MNLRKVDDTVHILTREKNLGSIPPYCKGETLAFDMGKPIMPKNVFVSDICLDCLCAYFQTNPKIKIKRKRRKNSESKK